MQGTTFGAGAIFLVLGLVLEIAAVCVVDVAPHWALLGIFAGWGAIGFGGAKMGRG